MPTNLQKTLVFITSLAAIFGLIFTQTQESIHSNHSAQTISNSAPIATSSESNTNAIEATIEPIAVVELFTSQGCSSCPPADRVLRELIEEGKQTGKRIYGLSFHVDYWNYLGWKDPYSKTDFSDRQRHYNQHLKSRGSYTPQMIVNGVSEFVGSKREYANQELAYALKTPAKIEIEITDLQLDKTKNQLQFECQLTGDCKSCKVNIAAVESNLKDAVKRGENSGRTLQHDNVVRAFHTQGFEASDKVILDLPKGMDFEESAVIVYVQEGKYSRIVGAIGQEFTADVNSR
ncbi:MAG: DUF1223 domain-containing protein [Chitinophagales bacterium]